MVKFWKGLDPQIQNTIATMAYGHPSNVSLEDWYQAAKNIDQNHAANEAFKMAYCTPTPITTRPVQSSLFQIPPPVICPSTHGYWPIPKKEPCPYHLLLMWEVQTQSTRLPLKV